MKKINVILLSFLVLSTSCLFADSFKKGVSKHFPSTAKIEQIVSTNDSGQKLSIAISSLSANGDLSSDYQSGMSIDFLVNCNKSCSLLGKELNLGLAFGFAPMCNDEDNVSTLAMGSVALHVMPNFNFPIDMNFGAGLSKAPGQMGVGMMGFISMDFFYNLSKCENISLGVQYKHYIDPEGSELNFSKLGTFGIGLKIDG